MEESDDKQHEPTAKRLEDARKKGEIVRSADLNTAAAYAGFVLTAAGLGAYSLGEFAELGQAILARAETMAPLLLSGGGTSLGGSIIGLTGRAAAPWFLLPAIAVLLSIFAQRSLVFTSSKLRPKLSRVSPIANAKNRFGRSGLFEFSKSAAKLTFYSILLGWYCVKRLPEFLAGMYLPAEAAAVRMVTLALEFLLVVIVVAACIAAADYLWQYHEHRRKHRMSTQELKDEIKQSEGDPHVKQQRRQRGMAIAMNKMLEDVPGADVVIVNPTHFAVALKWDRTSRGAPVCVAKGVDEIATRIREAAAEAGVPIHRDPPTARAIHATVEIGGEIPREQYRAVAAAIRFADEIRERARRNR